MPRLTSTAVVIISSLLLGACTRDQQNQISNAKIDQKAQQAWHTVEQHTDATVNWMATESAIEKVRMRLGSAVNNKTISDQQAESLSNSITYIQNLQNKAINSDGGITDAEKKQILAAVHTVEKRLDNSVAVKDKPEKKYE